MLHTYIVCHTIKLNAYLLTIQNALTISIAFDCVFKIKKKLPLFFCIHRNNSLSLTENSTQQHNNKNEPNT